MGFWGGPVARHRRRPGLMVASSSSSRRRSSSSASCFSTFFAVHLDWLPMGGYGTLAHLVLPSLTLGILGAGWYSRMMRSTHDRRAAAGLHAHGAREGPLAAPTSCSATRCPTRSSADLAHDRHRHRHLHGRDRGHGESVFGWPGIGQLAWQAIQRIDIPIIMGVTLVSACAIVTRQSARRSRHPVHRPRIE